MNMCLLLGACPALRERYAEKGIDEAIFWKSIEDMRWKLHECMDCEEVWGTFVPHWYRGFFEMTRFGLGRFQFEKRTLTPITMRSAATPSSAATRS